MILKGIGYFVKDNEPFTSPKNGKTYHSCEIQSINKLDTMKMAIPEPSKREFTEEHYPKVEFTIEQKTINGKNGQFTVNDLIELRRVK